MIAKLGVKLETLLPEMALLEPIIDDVYSEFDRMAVVTSTNDSKHKKNSLHYKDAAFDLRINFLVPVKQRKLHEQLKTEISEKYPDYYDVLLEYMGTPNAHIHVELSPQGCKAAGLEG